MQKNSLLFLLFFLLSCFCVGAPPVPFSGKLAVDGKNFQGNALFAFSIVDGEGAVHWKHSQENNATIENFVLNGRYLVLLGGQGMQTLPANLFLENENLFLRVRVDLLDGKGVRLLQPNQPITSTPYALAAELARLAEKASVADAVIQGAITADMIDAELLADLNKTITISDLPVEVVESMNRPITREMLPQDVRDDLNRTIGIAHLSAEVNEKLNRDFTIQPGSISKSLLGQDVLDDLNRTVRLQDLSDEVSQSINRPITREMLPQGVRDDLNATITRNRLSADVRADLNRTITKSMLSQEIKDDLNRTIGVAQLSSEVNEKLNRDFTIQPGSISKSLLGQDVLGDLNRTILRHHLSEELRAELNRTIRLRDLAPEVIADLNDSIAPGSITLDMMASGVRADLNRTISKSMLSQEIKDDLNRTIGVAQLSTEVNEKLNRDFTIQPGSISKSLLGQDVLGDLNRTIRLRDLAPEVIADLNDSIAPGSISLDMLASGVRADLNRTVRLQDLSPEVSQSINRSISLNDLDSQVITELNNSITPSSITLDLLSSQVRNDLNRTITKSMLSQEVLNELNSSSGGGGVVPGSLLAVPRNQSTPSGYSLYEEGELKDLVWEEKEPVSVARFAYDGVEVLGGKIYFVGGYNGSAKNIAEHYDPVTNTWETLANMSAARQGVACAVLNGKLYAIGGNGLSSVEVFDPSNGSWSAGVALPSEVTNGIAITVDGKIYLIGGNSSGQIINQVLCFDPFTSQWGTKANMPTARSGMKGVWFEDRIWVISGGISGGRTTAVESYDPTTDSWQAEASLITARAWPVAWVANGRIYVGGGFDGSSRLKSIEVYDSATKQWESAGNFPENKYVADAVVLNEKAYVVAGQTASNVYSNKVFAADLNASVSVVFDLYRKDGNASSGVPIVQAEVADGSIGPSKLSSEVSNALKPVVISQPNSVDSANGGSIYLSVGATGGDNNYHWKKDGVDITGATGSTLSITDLNASQHEGNYSVVVSNAFGSTSSGVAQIDVNGSITEGLVGWWKFDETSGNIAYDSSGNGNDGNLTNGPTWTEGKIGGALSFDGVDDMILIPYSVLNEKNVFTYSFWFLPTEVQGIHNTFLSVANLSSSNHILFWNRGLQLEVQLNDTKHQLTSNLDIGFWGSKWRTILLIHSSNGIRVYSDGLFLAELNYSNSSVSVASGGLIIGADQDSIGTGFETNQYLKGLIDDVRIYDRALSAFEVKALYELGEQPVHESGSGTTTVVNGTVANGSITTNQLSEQILKYLKPEITTQPQAQIIFADTNHTFSVSAEGKYLTYQWKKNGTVLAGETNTTLTITDANSTQHDGNYTVVVSNDFGSVESGEADMDVWNVGDDTSNVSLWLDASNVGSFELSNSVIQNWRDLSGNGNDMNISNGNPSLTGQLHGKTVAAYDGDDTTATTKNFSNDLDQSGYSIVALSRYAGNPRFRVISSGSLRNWLLGHHGGKHSTFFAENWVDSGTTGDLNWHIFSVTHEPAISYNNGVAPLSSFWLDGTNRAQNSGASSDTAPSPSDIVFGGVGEERSNCEVAEFIMIAAEISDTKRQEIEGYLAHKWGLRPILPNNHFYK